jgi:hypothetical protein
MQLLGSFQTINRFESSILRLMYMNWMADQIYQCEKSQREYQLSNSSLENGQRNLTGVCQHLAKDLNLNVD